MKVNLIVCLLKRKENHDIFFSEIKDLVKSKQMNNKIDFITNVPFNKMKSMDGVRLPGERRHKNRLDKGPRKINTDLVKKIKDLST